MEATRTLKPPENVSRHALSDATERTSALVRRAVANRIVWLRLRDHASYTQPPVQAGASLPRYNRGNVLSFCKSRKRRGDIPRVLMRCPTWRVLCAQRREYSPGDQPGYGMLIFLRARSGRCARPSISFICSINKAKSCHFSTRLEVRICRERHTVRRSYN
jgi:hypothetical protein